VLAAAMLLAALVGLLARSSPPQSPPSLAPTRFIIRTPGGAPLRTFDVPLAISPDGRELVYAVEGPGWGTGQLFHQSLAGFEPRAIEGSRGGDNPFFSPRGDTIGFRTPAALQRVDLTGGSAAQITAVVGSSGSSWGADGTVVFASAVSPLSVVRPGRSEAVALTRLDAENGEKFHLSPQILPGNRHVLFTIWNGSLSWDEAQLAVADLQTGQHTVVLRGGASGRYNASGHVIFWRGNALMAAPFDLVTLTLRGEPVRVVSDVRLFMASGAAHFAISDGGTLAYIAGKQGMFRESVVVDRSGQRLMRLGEEIGTGEPAFSPDGKRLALTLYRGATWSVGVFDLERGQITPIALTGDSFAPSWTSDGKRVAFVANRDSEYNRFVMRSDGSGTAEPQFAQSQGFSFTRSSWSRDGRHVAFERTWDIWVQDVVEGREPRPLIATPALEAAPTFSPDGRFVAYESDESGQAEVYVRPFPQVDARRELVSRSGGWRPAWSRDGHELFYMTDAGLMRVAVSSGSDDGPRFGQPSLLLKMSGIATFDVSPDGKTFAIERSPFETLANEIHVVLNFNEELKRLVPPK
jgi:serine/threonine-protein kinase